MPVTSVKKTIAVSNKLKDGNPYFEMAKLQHVEADMIKQLEIISNSMAKAADILKKAENAGYVKGELKNMFTESRVMINKRKKRADDYKYYIHKAFENDMMLFAKIHDQR